MAKTIKYPFPQSPRNVMPKIEELSFTQRVINVYKLLFWMFIPFVVMLLPTIPAILFNEWYMLLMIITFPVGIALFSFATDKIIEI